ncbi:MAG: sigma-70 family RNA polymerase sigma factor [Saprospiraceae bacterium]|nr:sigma-70 family RNA polymerase sigma factor [Saprospiraceae bacterium]
MAYTNLQIRDGLKENDAEIFRYLYKTYGSMIVGYVRKNSGSDQEAREMVQTVLLEFWTAVREDRYQESGKLDRYLYILTSNTWRDELRRRKVRRTDELDTNQMLVADDHEQSIAMAIVKDRRIEAMHHCLQQLESPCDDIIRLYHLEEVNLQEVAKQMNYDYNNLRKRIFDCRKKLKKLVDDFLQQTPLTIADI